MPVTREPLNITNVVGDPLHTTWFVGWVTVGVGFTVITNVFGKPWQETPAFK